MFGIKIISERDYYLMCSLTHDAKELDENRVRKINSLSEDCDSLRNQLNEKMKEVNKLREQNNNYLREVKSLREFKRDTLEAMGHIDLAGFQLQHCTKKCKHCENEQHECKKYEFGKHQYCVIPK